MKTEKSERLEAAKKKLDGISPSFCAAKWLQATLLLQNGQTRSCHHCPAHKIPLRGLDHNPAQLHNTPLKKSMRQAMLAGERPAECAYCWEMEKVSALYSDRHIKAGDPWAFPFIEELAAAPWDADTAPTYLEVSFGLECGLSCMYCYPYVSRAVLADYKANGPYPVTYPVDRAYLMREHNFSAELEPLPPDNDYVAAFWNWFPAIAGKLKVLRLTGGEPLLNANTFKVLDYLEEHPAPGLELSVNSNLSVAPAVYDRFLKQCRRLAEGGKVGRLALYTSLEAQGAQSDYIRSGSDYSLILANCRRWLEEIPRGGLVFMSAFNILSFTSFRRFAADVLALKREYNSADRQVLLDVSILKDPYYLRPILATPEMIALLAGALDFMRLNSGSGGFIPYEIDKTQRVYDLLRKPAFHGANRYVSRRDFARFIREYDRRRSSDFAAAFQELSPFMDQCGSLVNAVLGMTVFS